MSKNILYVFIIFVTSFVVNAEENLISLQSQYSAKETADRFESIIKNKGLTLFARIDHQQNAAKVNLSLRPTEVLIFGNPKIGTLLMQCTQSIAIDLPQKILVTQDVENRVWLSYNNPNYLKTRHNIQGCDDVTKKIEKILNKLSMAATTK